MEAESIAAVLHGLGEKRGLVAGAGVEPAISGI